MVERQIPQTRERMEVMLGRIVLVAAQFGVIGVALCAPPEYLKSHAHLFYLVHYILFLPFLFSSRDRCAFLFSPSFLIISYVSLSFIIGGFAFSRGYVLRAKDYTSFCRWDHFNGATAYFMLCNLFALLAFFLSQRGRSTPPERREASAFSRYRPQLFVGILLLVVFSRVNLSLGFLGGSGDFSIGPRTFGFLVVTIVLAKTRWRYRVPMYLCLLFVFAASEYSNRRVTLLLALSVLFTEVAHLPRLRFSLRPVLIGVALVGMVIVLQMTMTIARGLAGFEGAYWRTFGELGRFAELDNAATISLKQTEGPTIFYHSNNAIHYVLEDTSLLCYGSTLTKVFFIPIPRSVWPNKPPSMVHRYTSRWDPAFRRSGGSTVANVYAEYFWNFHMFGVFCVVPIFYCLNRVFFFYLLRLRTGRVWPYVYVGIGYTFLLTYGRGHGLYNLVNTAALAFIVQVVLFYPLVCVMRAMKHRSGLSPLGRFLFQY